MPAWLCWLRRALGTATMGLRCIQMRMCLYPMLGGAGTTLPRPRPGHAFGLHQPPPPPNRASSLPDYLKRADGMEPTLFLHPCWFLHWLPQTRSQPSSRTRSGGLACPWRLHRALRRLAPAPSSRWAWCCLEGRCASPPFVHARMWVPVGSLYLANGWGGGGLAGGPAPARVHAPHRPDNNLGCVLYNAPPRHPAGPRWP